MDDLEALLRAHTLTDSSRSWTIEHTSVVVRVTGTGVAAHPSPSQAFADGQRFLGLILQTEYAPVSNLQLGADFDAFEDSGWRFYLSGCFQRRSEVASADLDVIKVPSSE